MQKLVGYLSALLASFALTACAGGDEYYTEADGGDEVGQAEQAVTAKPGMGAQMNGNGACTANPVSTCYYAPSKALTVRLDNGQFTSFEKSMAQSALTTVLARFNQQMGSSGWSATQVSGQAGSVASVVITSVKFGFPNGLQSVNSIVQTSCLLQGPALAEQPAQGGTHRLCHRVQGVLDLDNILSAPNTDWSGYMRHAIGSTLEAAAGRGWEGAPTDQSGYSAFNLLPKNKTGLTAKDVCLIGAYSPANPTILSRTSIGC